MPVCIKCGIDKPADEFYPQTGRGTRRTDCKACNIAGASARANASRAADPEKHSRWAKSWQARHPEKVKAAFKKWKEAHMAEWRRQYTKKHPEKYAAKAMRREARKLQAMPSWANPVFIADMYMIARLVSEATGVKHHVDHIIPLRSPLVCGLHVEDNLQVITMTLNSSKRNNFSVEA